MKKELRKKILDKRNELTKVDVNNLSKEIINRIKEKFDFSRYQVIGMYMPLGNEVDLRPLIDELIAQNKTIVIPKVFDKHNMDFYPIKNSKDIHVGRFNVLEPNSTKKMPKNEIQLMFIPGIAFSYDFYRLGYGAGYYDRYLIDYINQKIGICFSFQYIESFPTDSYDIPMNQIITENP